MTQIDADKSWEHARSLQDRIDEIITMENRILEAMKDPARKSQAIIWRNERSRALEAAREAVGVPIRTGDGAQPSRSSV